MKYTYFVSYHYNDRIKSGYGNAFITIDFQITKYENLKQVKEILSDVDKATDQKYMIILNFQLIETTEE